MQVWEILAAAALCCAVFCLIYAANKKLLLPKTGCCGVTVTATVRASGRAPCLEQTVNGLVWLRQGGMDMDIVIEDAGLVPQQRQLAEILAREKDVSLTRVQPEQTDPGR